MRRCFPLASDTVFHCSKPSWPPPSSESCWRFFYQSCVPSAATPTTCAVLLTCASLATRDSSLPGKTMAFCLMPVAGFRERPTINSACSPISACLPAVAQAMSLPPWPAPVRTQVSTAAVMSQGGIALMRSTSTPWVRTTESPMTSPRR